MAFRKCKCGKYLIYTSDHSCAKCKDEKKKKEKERYNEVKKKTMDIDKGLKPYQKHGRVFSYNEIVERANKINK